MRLFSTDIDGTIYDGPETAQRFAAFWTDLRASDRPAILVMNTGRSVADARNLVATTDLPDPDYIIGGVGTEVFNFATSEIIAGWAEELSGEWDFDRVESIVRAHCDNIEMQPAECQNPFKCSWFWENKSQADLDGLAAALSEAGLETQVIYSSNRDLDILSLQANKGNAIAWLSETLDIPLAEVVVAGDSGNDSSMFLIGISHGIVVSNAEPALFTATESSPTLRPDGACAHGVIEALTALRDSAPLASS